MEGCPEMSGEKFVPGIEALPFMGCATYMPQNLIASYKKALRNISSTARSYEVVQFAGGIPDTLALVACVIYYASMQDVTTPAAA